MNRVNILDEIEKIIDEKTIIYKKLHSTNDNTERDLLKEQIELCNIELDTRYNILRINTHKNEI